MEEQIEDSVEEDYGYVLSVTDRYDIEKYQLLTHVPAGQVVFVGPNDMAAESEISDLLVIWSKLLKVPVSQGDRDKLDVARLIWEAVGGKPLTATADDVIPADPENRRGPKGPRERYDCGYERLFDVDDEVYAQRVRTLPPQARACLEVLSLMPGAVTPEPELKRAINDAKKAIKTRQDAWRIFQYYRPRFIAEGYLRVITIEKA
jgi:hypothetical protein